MKNVLSVMLMTLMLVFSADAFAGKNPEKHKAKAERKKAKAEKACAKGKKKRCARLQRQAAFQECLAAGTDRKTCRQQKKEARKNGLPQQAVEQAPEENSAQ